LEVGKSKQPAAFWNELGSVWLHKFARFLPKNKDTVHFKIQRTFGWPIETYFGHNFCMILGKKIFGSNSYFFSLTLQATNNMSSTASITSSTPRVNAPTPAKWTSARTLVLLECVRDQILLGKTSDTGLKKEAWAAIVISFNSKCNLHYDKQKLQSQLAVQKKKYQIVKTLRDNSGFGWDEAKQVPTAPDDVWIEYIAAHPEARPFRNSPLDHYVYLEEIFTGVIATGEYAVASGFNHDLDTNRNSADQDFSENLDSTNSNESAQTKRKISAVSIRKSPRKRIKSNPMRLLYKIWRKATQNTQR
jgi:hypothetical protein